MARSPLTLAAAVTAAVPGAEAVRARPLTTDSDGRFDSAVVDLSDGSTVAIRVSGDEDAARELAAEAIALRALTAGARSILPFAAPEYRGDARLGDASALVTSLVPGFQIEAGHVPAGPGAAVSFGRAIAAIHTLPASVVRGAGLSERSAEEVRRDVAELIDAASATGRVPARLTVRWRAAADDDTLWRFESSVVLGGSEATSFLFEDHAELGPQVTGVLHWHALSIGDPAQDLSWVASARGAAEDIHTAYAEASQRAHDETLALRARLYAELEFARWLVHGEKTHRSDVVDDAAGLLQALADGLRNDDLRVIAERDGIDSALDAVTRMPETAAPTIDTSMQTDTYKPDEFSLLGQEDHPTEDHSEDVAALRASDAAESDETPTDHAETEPPAPTEPAILPRTRPAGTVPASNDAEFQDPVSQSTAPLDPLWKDEAPRPSSAPATRHDTAAETLFDDVTLDDDEAQRAARAALQRWKSSDSE